MEDNQEMDMYMEVDKTSSAVILVQSDWFEALK